MSGILYAEDEHRPALKEMWKLCFPEDTDTFIDFYFNHVYQNEETLIYVENDRPVASLQILPYQIKIKRQRYDAGYISGAMTHPDFRRKKYMEKLLIFAFDEMKRKGMSLSFLIPQEDWLFDFYARYGYQKAFSTHIPEKLYLPDRNSEESSDNYQIDTYTSFNSIHLEFLYSIYSSFLEQKENVILKNLHQFSNILRDFFIENGTLFVNRKGIAFAASNKENVYLKEFFYIDNQTKNEFLNCILSHFSKKEILAIHSEETPISSFSGMIKVLDETIVLPENIYMSMMLN